MCSEKESVKQNKNERKHTKKHHLICSLQLQLQGDPVPLRVYGSAIFVPCDKMPCQCQVPGTGTVLRVVTIIVFHRLLLSSLFNIITTYDCSISEISRKLVYHCRAKISPCFVKSIRSSDARRVQLRNWKIMSTGVLRACCLAFSKEQTDFLIFL